MTCFSCRQGRNSALALMNVILAIWATQILWFAIEIAAPVFAEP